MKTFTKIVIRKLPKDLKEDEFLAQIEPYSNFNYFRFCETNKNEYGSCRAYINFSNEDEMYAFKNDNEFKLFYDSNGNCSYGLFEFAVCQKVPSENKPDNRMNTLENDPEFKKFLEEMENKDNFSIKETLESNLEEIKNKEAEKSNKPVTTHLIEFIKNDKPKKETNFNPTSIAKRDKKAASKEKESKKEVVSPSKKSSSKEDSYSKPKSGDNKKHPTNSRSDIRAYAYEYENSRRDGGGQKGGKPRYYESGWYDNDYNAYYSSNYDYYGGGGGRYTDYYGRSKGVGGGGGYGYSSGGNKRGGSNNNNKSSGNRKYPPAPYRKD